MLIKTLVMGGKLVWRLREDLRYERCRVGKIVKDLHGLWTKVLKKALGGPRIGEYLAVDKACEIF